MSSIAYDRDYHQKLVPVLTILTAAGVQLYRLTPEPALSFDDVWIPLRPALGLWRVPHAAQRWIEQQLRKPPTRDKTPSGMLHWDGHWQHLLVSMRCVQAHVLPEAAHPACLAYTHWHTEVLVALMHHGTYDPAHNHAPRPGEELDALERREHLQATFDEHFPWFKRLPRYRIVEDAAGHKYAEEIALDLEEDPDDDPCD
jgi:hypothetical protein